MSRRRRADRAQGRKSRHGPCAIGVAQEALRRKIYASLLVAPAPRISHAAATATPTDSVLLCPRRVASRHRSVRKIGVPRLSSAPTMVTLVSKYWTASTVPNTDERAIHAARAHDGRNRAGPWHCTRMGSRRLGLSIFPQKRGTPTTGAGHRRELDDAVAALRGKRKTLIIAASGSSLRANAALQA